MPSVRARVLVCAAFFAAIIVLGVAGNMLQGAHVIPPSGAGLWMKVLFFGLVIGFVFSAVPALVGVVLAAQRRRAGNDVAPAMAFLSAEGLIIVAMWLLMAAGLALAIPAAIADGAFRTESVAPQRP